MNDEQGEPLPPIPNFGSGSKNAANSDAPTEVVPTPPEGPLIVRQMSTPATIALLLINVAVFAVMVTKTGSQTLSVPTTTTLMDWGANFGPLTTNGQLWRLFTSMFLHVGSIHIAFNMYALWNLGRTAERFYGTPRFFVVYLLSGLAGSCASLLHNPVIVSAGASGAIFGIFGALLSFATIQKMSGGDPRYSRIQQSVLKSIAINLAIGFSVPKIDNSAHVGGLIFGVLAGAVFAPIEIRGFSMSQRTRGMLGACLLIAILGIASGMALTLTKTNPKYKEYVGGNGYTEYYELIKPLMPVQDRIERELRSSIRSQPPTLSKEQAHDLAQRADASLKDLQSLKLPNTSLDPLHQPLVKQAVNLAAAAHALEEYTTTSQASALEKVMPELQKSAGLNREFADAVAAYNREYGLNLHQKTSTKPAEDPEPLDEP